MYGRQVYFALPELRIEPGDAVVDLGANRGLFSLLALRLGAQRAIAVEAQGGFIPLIRQLLDRNGCADRALVEWCMVGAEAGALADPAVAEAASHWQAGVPIRSMRELLERSGIQRIDFLKMDIEGSEFDLLAHDNAWLRDVRRLAMEVHKDFGEPALVARILAQAGLTVRLARPDLHFVASPNSDVGYIYAFR